MRVFQTVLLPNSIVRFDFIDLSNGYNKEAGHCFIKHLPDTFSARILNFTVKDEYIKLLEMSIILGRLMDYADNLNFKHLWLATQNDKYDPYILSEGFIFRGSDGINYKPPLITYGYKPYSL